ncbi:MAG TPA: MBL fold metallo-hydrolase [Candidatus Acidoferrales bacterium]|nr:MBL fold metallo-hydrolase [Candidatus Acidoferrales bacterium]
MKRSAHTSSGWAFRAASHFLRRYNEERTRPIRPAPLRPDPKAWPDRGLHAAWIGHSTVLLKIDGVTILTDPVFSRRVGIRLGPLTLGIKRLVEPALPIRELPRIDLILLSHAHMDHFDIRSLRRLESRGATVVTARRTSDLLRVRRYGRVQELGWNETATVGPLTVRAFPVNHWGARMRTDTYRGYNGYTIEAGRHRVLFGGDTALTDSFQGLKKRRAYDLAIMPVGAYDPWIHYHCTPEQAWRMAHDAGFEFFLPVHHQTLLLSREPYLEPIERVYGAAGRHGARVAVRQIGQEFRL